LGFVFDGGKPSSKLWETREACSLGFPRFHQLRHFRSFPAAPLLVSGPSIQGELLKLGFQISERTVSRYLARRLPRPGDSAKNWLAFLSNHREMIAALDFFTVPTIRLRLLYCFFVTDHGRRRILHFNVTAHPTAEWVVQQLREAFTDSDRHRYVILDRDSKFSREVVAFLKSSGIRPVRTSVHSPWQNGVAEGWVSGTASIM
jgi:putative transposase